MSEHDDVQQDDEQDKPEPVIPALSPVLTPEEKKQKTRELVLRTLAGRDRDGKRSDKLSLLGDDDDVEFYLVINDVGGELQDEFTDACSQTEQSSAAKFNADGQAVSEPTMERRNRLWPAIRVLCVRRLISEAVLPKLDEKTEELTGYVWKKSPEANMAFLNTCDYLLLAQIVRVASDFFLATEGHKAAMDFFSASRAKPEGS